MHVGERFTLTLTCALLDAADGRVVADRDRLDPAALDLTPFEIVGGTRHDDIEASPRRYFQYSYTLRLFGDEHFGRDVDIPSIPITYSIETSGATATRGREQLYILPALPVRMLSLVPVTATDIQDAASDTFGDIDRRTLRADGELTAAGVLFTLAAVLAGLAIVRVARPRLAAAEQGLLSPGEMLRGCLREATRVKTEAQRAGWTADLIGEALTVLRIAGTLTLGRSVAQQVVEGSVTARDGQLAIRKGALRARRVVISGAATSSSIDELNEGLRVFTAARYGRANDLDRARLDATLDSAIDAMRRLYEKQQWRRRMADAVSRAGERMKTQWAR